MIFSIFEYNFTLGKTIILLLAITLVFMISLAFHELAHGFVAYKQGDPTPKASGRLTLNPLSHIDATGFIMFLLMGIGWAKPVPVNPTNFKKYRSGIAKVSIAGVAANLILCILASFLYILAIKITGDAQDVVAVAMFWFMWANASLMFFNLIPLYPLDGFNFISSFMRADNKFVQANIRNSGRIFMGILIADLLLELVMGISIIRYIIMLLTSLICNPLCKLWTLIFF